MPRDDTPQAAPDPEPVLTPLAQWQALYYQCAAEGLAHLPTLELIEAQHPGLTVQACAEVARLTRLGRPPAGALPPSVAPTGRR